MSTPAKQRANTSHLPSPCPSVTLPPLLYPSPCPSVTLPPLLHIIGTKISGSASCSIGIDASPIRPPPESDTNSWSSSDSGSVASESPRRLPPPVDTSSWSSESGSVASVLRRPYQVDNSSWSSESGSIDSEPPVPLRLPGKDTSSSGSDLCSSASDTSMTPLLDQDQPLSSEEEELMSDYHSSSDAASPEARSSHKHTLAPSERIFLQSPDKKNARAPFCDTTAIPVPSYRLKLSPKMRANSDVRYLQRGRSAPTKRLPSRPAPLDYQVRYELSRAKGLHQQLAILCPTSIYTQEDYMPPHNLQDIVSYRVLDPTADLYGTPWRGLKEATRELSSGLPTVAMGWWGTATPNERQQRREELNRKKRAEEAKRLEERRIQEAKKREERRIGEKRKIAQRKRDESYRKELTREQREEMERKHRKSQYNPDRYR
ncbi:hypothetical protein EDC01DRAFT_629273 [Geopyxis carbonaria]|nr:hypothetical protein EDC01DRAFT_629273 [Geopyxis carbonaria]